MADENRWTRDVGQRLKRTGWVNNKVQLPESVADHMYRMGMCCMLVDEVNPAVNRSRYSHTAVRGAILWITVD